MTIRISKKDTVESGCAILAFQLSIMAAKNMLVSTIPFFAALNSKINSIMLIVFVLLYLYLFIFKSYIRAISQGAYLVLICLALFIGITILFDPIRFTSNTFPYSYVKSQGITFITYCLPSFLVVAAFSRREHFDILLDDLFKYIPFLFIASAISFLGGVFFASGKQEYSMSYGNAVLFLVVLLLLKYYDKPSFIILIEVLFCVIFILTLGSRNPLISIALGLIFLLYRSNRTNSEKILGVILPVLLLLCIIFYSSIISVVGNAILRIDSGSRTARLLLGGKLFYDSGRKIIIDQLKQALFQHPIRGLGAFGGEATVGLSHNFYWDFFANFGLLFGPILLCILLYNIVKIIVENRNTSLGNLVFILAIVVFPRGFVVHDFWTTKELWMLLGIVVSYPRLVALEGENAVERDHD